MKSSDLRHVGRVRVSLDLVMIKEGGEYRSKLIALRGEDVRIEHTSNLEETIAAIHHYFPEVHNISLSCSVTQSLSRGGALNMAKPEGCAVPAAAPTNCPKTQTPKESA